MKINILTKRGESLKRLFLCLFLCLFLSGASHADGTLQMLGTTKVKNLSGTALTQGSVIQVITANTPPTDKKQHALSTDNSLVMSGTVGGGSPVATNSNGTFNYFSEYDGKVYLRVWDLTSLSNIQGKNYATVGPMSLPAPPTPPETFVIDNFSTAYKADVPPKPTVKAPTGFALSYDSKARAYLPSFTLVVVDGKYDDGSLSEATGYAIKITRLKTGMSQPLINQKSKLITETDAHDPFYRANEWYEAKARAGNYFGWGEWGAATKFQIPASGGTASGPGEVSYTFQKNKDKLGIYTFAIPFDTTKTITDKDSNTLAVNDIDQLISTLNVTAGSNKTPVKVFGYYDQVKQQVVGLTSIVYDSKGQIDATKTTTTHNLKVADILKTKTVRDLPYQVAVDETVSLTMKGTR